jgi:hypothetical protein
MFKLGDKVRVIRGLNLGTLTVGEIYTVLAVWDDVISLLEFGPGGWYKDRFELVSMADPGIGHMHAQQQTSQNGPVHQQQQHAFNRLPSVNPYEALANQIHGIPAAMLPMGIGAIISDNNDPMFNHPKCECGTASVGGNKHSDWCPVK